MCLLRVPLDSSEVISWSGIFTPVGYCPVSSSARTVRPVLVVVAAIELTMTSWLDGGLPRQFMEMWEKSLCST